LSLRALLVSYNFPPTGGAGVARMLKLAKYLPAHGVTPTVLTVKNPSVPVADTSLARDLSDAVDVVRTRTLEPGYAIKRAAWRASAERAGGVAARLRRGVYALGRQLMVPDPQVLWLPGAAAELVLRDEELVLVSGPPFSQFLLAPLARRRAGRAVMLDYRDEWSTYRDRFEMMGRAAAWVGAPLERALVRSAHAITTATEAFRAQLLARFTFLDPARVHAIPNGYDPDDLPDELPEPPDDRLVVTYAGTIFALTRCPGLLAAIRRLHREEPALARLLEVNFVGRIVDTEAAAFAGMAELGVHVHGYVNHAEVVGRLARSHRVLCLLDDVPGAERIYPGKIFELAAIGRPCLTLAPEGALAELVRRHRLGEVLAPREEGAIAAYLLRALREFQAGQLAVRTNAVDIERYDRSRLAGEFADVMRAAAAHARQSL
jgi:glycosyltransferase involved in cell wall biosynthesis